MASYYDTQQWYQSRRSSAAHQKIEKKIEMETTGSAFLPPCRYDKSPKTFDEKLRLVLKRLDEMIDSYKKSPPKMIDAGFSPGIPTDYSLDHVSTDPQKIGCEEASIVEPSLAANGEESQQIIEAGAVLDFQVSLQTKNSKSYKKYKRYSAVELDDRRDRGLCLWCDEIWYIGHECCNKTLYVVEMDINDEYAMDEMEPLVDGKLVVEEVTHCDNKLIVDYVQKDSSEMSNFVCGDEKESWEASEVVGMYNALQLVEELPKEIALEDVAENYVIPTNFGRNILWLDDVGCGKLLAIMFKTHSPSVIEALFSLLSRLGGLHKPWIALPELPLPPPEPPPRMI